MILMYYCNIKTVMVIRHLAWGDKCVYLRGHAGVLEAVLKDVRCGTVTSVQSAERKPAIPKAMVWILK